MANDKQTHLFDVLPPHNSTSTSVAAAEAVAPLVKSMEQQVVEFFTYRGQRGATCDEVEAALGLKHQTASARVNGLKEGPDPVIVDSGHKRKTRSGCRATVYWLAHFVGLTALSVKE